MHIQRAIASVGQFKFALSNLKVLLQLSQDNYSQMIDKGVFEYTYNINEIMRIFSLFDVLFVFPGFITSFYGMNIKLPMMDEESYWPMGVLLGIMAIYVTSLLIWIKKFKMKVN